MATTTYTIDCNNTNIQLNLNPILNIPISSLYLNNEQLASNKDDFIISQQQVNYLDCVKDGTNVYVLQSLDLFPLAGQSGVFPTFPDNLKQIETNILKVRESYLNRTTWLKVKKNTRLDPPKQYTYCFWESGLGYENYMVGLDGGLVKTVKTFGSYIDPLEKSNATEVWPPINKTITLQSKFMELMGFGENSSITATTLAGNKFNYNMKIGCGTACSTPNICSITYDGRGNNDPNEIFFAGNNAKKNIVNNNSNNTQNKVKLVVVKEWGDKVQVLIYLYFYYLHKNEKMSMTTCDMVVFMLCLNLNIPCIYTGAYKPPDRNKKYYSILEFNPSTNPLGDAFTRLQTKTQNIIDENADFIKALKAIIQSPNTPVTIDGSEYTFNTEFYKIALRDVTNINKTATNNRIALINSLRPVNRSTLTENSINLETSKFQKMFLVVPFLKVKKGTNSTLTMLRTRSYTVNTPNEKSSFNIDKAYSNKSFSEIALKYFKVSPTRVQLGGNKLTNSAIQELFSQDDDGTRYITQSNGLPKKINIYDYTFTPENANDAPYTSEEQTAQLFNNFDNNNSLNSCELKTNLLVELNSSFNAILHIYPDTFKDTIYTIFIYKSYLDGYANSTFDGNDLTNIISDYSIDNFNAIDIPSTPIYIRNFEEDRRIHRQNDKLIVTQKRQEANQKLNNTQNFINRPPTITQKRRQNFRNINNYQYLEEPQPQYASSMDTFVIGGKKYDKHINKIKRQKKRRTNKNKSKKNKNKSKRAYK